MQQIVAWVPSGKGMAGLALERGIPIQTCNLKEDASGAVKAGARAVDPKGAVAIPVKAADGGVRAVVGIAFADERQFTPSELDTLSEAVKTFPMLRSFIAVTSLLAFAALRTEAWHPVRRVRTAVE